MKFYASSTPTCNYAEGDEKLVYTKCFFPTQQIRTLHKLIKQKSLKYIFLSCNNTLNKRMPYDAPHKNVVYFI